MSFKPIDERKEGFRMYLAENGVLDSLTKVIAKIYEYQPEDPLAFLQENLSVSLVHQSKIQELEEKLEASQLEVARLERELKEAKQ